VASCVGYLGYFYGDHAGKVCFVVDKSRLTFSARARQPVAVTRH
jgi:hypothetical protein